MEFEIVLVAEAFELNGGKSEALSFHMEIKEMVRSLGDVSAGTYNRLLEHDAGRSNGWRGFW